MDFQHKLNEAFEPLNVGDIEDLVGPEYVVNTDPHDKDVLWIAQSPKYHPDLPVHPDSVNNDNGGYCYADTYFCVWLYGVILPGVGDGYHRDFTDAKPIKPDQLKQAVKKFYETGEMPKPAKKEIPFDRIPGAEPFQAYD